jgi:hypothetical protein
MGFLSRTKKEEPNRTELIKIEQERFLLSNLQRGTEIGDFVTVCRTDYVQTFSDPWIARVDYQWVEYLLLVKNLLQKPDDLTALVYLPQDLSEVYYVVVPAQGPNHTHLTQKGRTDYEFSPGYEAAVDAALAKDYSSLAKRSVFHSVEPQSGWDLIVNAVLAGEMETVAVEYNGIKYVYGIPTDEKEAEASDFTAYATRRGAYPMEESLRTDRKFDIVPAIPNGVTGKVTVREFVTDPKAKAPFERISFQRTEVPPGSVQADQPNVMTNISFGNDLDPNESLSKYLSLKYVQLEQRNPVVKILGQF